MKQITISGRRFLLGDDLSFFEGFNPSKEEGWVVTTEDGSVLGRFPLWGGAEQACQVAQAYLTSDKDEVEIDISDAFLDI